MLFSLYNWNVIINPQKLPAHSPSKHSLVSSTFSEQCFKSKVGIALGWKFRVRFLCPFPHVLLHELQDDHGVSISLHDAVMPPKIHISVNLYLYSISIYLSILQNYPIIRLYYIQIPFMHLLKHGCPLRNSQYCPFGHCGSSRSSIWHIIPQPFSKKSGWININCSWISLNQFYFLIMDHIASYILTWCNLVKLY